jgi:hypothetical protein
MGVNITSTLKGTDNAKERVASDENSHSSVLAGVDKGKKKLI